MSPAKSEERGHINFKLTVGRKIKTTFQWLPPGVPIASPLKEVEGSEKKKNAWEREEELD